MGDPEVELARLGTLVEQGFRSVHAELRDIKIEVKRTNGRVNVLEQADAVRKAEGPLLRQMTVYVTIVGGTIAGTLAVLEFLGRL